HSTSPPSLHDALPIWTWFRVFPWAAFHVLLLQKKPDVARAILDHERPSLVKEFDVSVVGRQGLLLLRLELLGRLRVVSAGLALRSEEHTSELQSRENL